MLDTEFCRNILKLPEPWLVESVRVDKPSNRIDIQVTLNVGRGGMFRRQPNCPRCHRSLPQLRDAKQRVLRHLNLGEMRTYLSVPVIEGNGPQQHDCGCRRSWAKVGSRFTHEMERLVVEGLHLLGSISAVSKLYGINVSDVREINAQNNILEFEEPQGPESKALAYGQAHFDEGGLQVAYLEGHAEAHVEQQPKAAIVAAETPAPGSPDGSVPAESHPVWQRLIDERISVSANAIGLKMLLEQIRLTVGSNPSEITRLAGARILRQYFVKHWHRNKAELAQLLNTAQHATAEAESTRAAPEVPAENSPGWQDLIDGRIPIRSDAIGLKMLLERLRLTLGSQPLPAGRLAGARILRQYFVKHHTRHRAELEMLHASRRRSAAAPAAHKDTVIPEETAQCWQMLISGALDIHTNAVGLTMLIERIRLTLGRNPSEPARLAAARVLRQYFEKYHTRHEYELRLLTSAEVSPGAAVGGQVVEFVEVPPETHPNWQKLISGELQIRTDALGLKMLLERVRISLGTEPSDALRLAAARVLRQYFIKHRSRHRAELEQLKAA
jgi:hypothetical protein